MELKDVVLKLVGNVQPVGDTNTDEDRFTNLKVLVELINDLVTELEYVSRNKNSYQYSVKKAGIFAGEALKQLSTYGGE